MSRSNRLSSNSSRRSSGVVFSRPSFIQSPNILMWALLSSSSVSGPIEVYCLSWNLTWAKKLSSKISQFENNKLPARRLVHSRVSLWSKWAQSEWKCSLSLSNFLRISSIAETSFLFSSLFSLPSHASNTSCNSVTAFDAFWFPWIFLPTFSNKSLTFETRATVSSKQSATSLSWARIWP